MKNLHHQLFLCVQPYITKEYIKISFSENLYVLHPFQIDFEIIHFKIIHRLQNHPFQIDFEKHHPVDAAFSRDNISIEIQNTVQEPRLDDFDAFRCLHGLKVFFEGLVACCQS